jgi:hypothetical protein
MRQRMGRFGRGWTYRYDEILRRRVRIKAVYLKKTRRSWNHEFKKVYGSGEYVWYNGNASLNDHEADN